MRGLWWAASLLLLAVVWVSGSSAAPLGLSLRHPFDWLGHLLAYLVLGYALGRATGRTGLALALAAWVGAADEVHQAFVAGREAGIQDWLWSLLGAWLGTRLSRRLSSRPGSRPGSRAAPGRPPEASDFQPGVPPGPSS